MGSFLCLVCNLGAIRDRFRRVFLFGVVRGVVSPQKNEGRRVTVDERVPQIALVSLSNADNRRKNTIFIKPHNFYIVIRGLLWPGLT